MRRCDDVRAPHPSLDVWHDRAVCHFLIDQRDRVAHVRQSRAVKPGGHVIVAMFGPEGPTKWSGLDVIRYGRMRCMTSSARAFD